MLALFEYAYMAFSSVAVLSILVFVHELGHFLVAKWCGVAVSDFAIGFGKVLWGKKWGETYYTVRAIPLGGYVRMIGDDPFEVEDYNKVPEGENSKSSTAPHTSTSVLEQPTSQPSGVSLKDFDKSRWFLSKSLSAKAAIVLAGPVFNLVFAYAVAVSSYSYFGKTVDVEAPIIGGVVPGLPAAVSGLKRGDKVTSINGNPISTWIELSTTVRASAGQPMRFVFERMEADTKVQVIEKEIVGSSEMTELNVLDGTYDKDKKERPYRIGIAQEVSYTPVATGEAFTLGAQKVWGICQLTGRLIYAMVSGFVSPSKVLGGPIAVFSGAAQSAKHGMESVLNFMVLLSVSLAIFNLLPIPVLDGGHLMFFIIEKFRGAPLSMRWQSVANQIGLALLALLMIFAVSNDIFRML